jgi:hypothetical protein
MTDIANREIAFKPCDMTHPVPASRDHPPFSKGRDGEGAIKKAIQPRTFILKRNISKGDFTDIAKKSPASTGLFHLSYSNFI